MTFEVRYHGGACCGMTHISGFPKAPDFMFPEVVAITLAQQRASNLERRNDYFGVSRHHPRPAESAGDRFKALIRCVTHGDPESMWTTGRARGCIEVTLIDAQLMQWGEFLTELGFKEVNTFVNGNTCRTIHVPHLNTGQ